MWEQINEEILPYALMIGVDYELFWVLNPKSLKPFVKAFNLQTKHEDMIAWQSGIYIRMAVASVMDKNVKYPKTPLMSKDVVTKSPKQIQEEIKQKMFERMIAINSRFGKGE